MLLLPLAACSGTASDAADTAASSAASLTSGASGETSGGSGAGNSVDCSLTSCSITLSGDGQVEVLGTTVSLARVENGRATLGVAGKEISCAQGEDVAAGPLTLSCTTVTDDGVTLTASLG
jgi:hypothetical protein